MKLLRHSPRGPALHALSALVSIARHAAGEARPELGLVWLLRRASLLLVLAVRRVVVAHVSSMVTNFLHRSFISEASVSGRQCGHALALINRMAPVKPVFGVICCPWDTR
jgi:hypothetical protein